VASRRRPFLHIPPFICVAAGLFLAQAAPAQATTLNLSQDLVTLGIAATNMVPNQPSLDAGPLFMQGVNYAKTHGITTVVADPGTYYFLSVVGNTHAAVAGIDNMTIDLHGANLIFTHPLYYGLIVYTSTNATIQNLTADFQPLPFTQLRVVSVDVPNASIQFTVEPGYQDPSTFNSPPAGVGTPSFEVHVFRNGYPAPGTRRMLTQIPFSGDHFTVSSFTAPEAVGAVRPGDVVVIVMRGGGGDAVNANHCTGCTLRNITVYSAATGGAAVGMPGSTSNLMERIYVVPKLGTDRLISTTSAIFVGTAGPGNQIRLSRGIRTTDDAFWFFGRIVGSVQSQPTAASLVVTPTTAWTVLSDNDSVPNGTAVTFQRPSDGAVLASATIVSQSPPSGQPPQATYTFDHTLPGAVIGSVMYSTDANQNGANSTLERSTVQNQSPCCKGTYFAGLANSSVRGNYIRRSGLAGVFLLQGMTPGDPPTPPLVNMTVTHNVIDGTNVTSDWWWFELGSIQSVTLTTGFDLMTTSPMSNTSVTNNFIADSGRSAVWLGNTAGGTVTGNYLFRPNQRPDLANMYPARPGDALVPLVIDTTSTGVVISNNTVDNTSGRLVVTDTQFRELAAYAPGATIRLSAHNLGGVINPSITLTDADGNTTPMTIQGASPHAIDVQVPAAAPLGGAFATLTSDGAKRFGTLFVDSQDNIPSVNGCTIEPNPSATTISSVGGSVPILVVTQSGCAYQVVSNDPYVTAGSGGPGTAVISVAFAANSGMARTATIEIAGRPLTITQSAFTTFTDANVSGLVVKAVHVAELRARVNAVRIAKGLSAFAWTDPALNAGSTAVRAIHLQELRTALNQAYVAANHSLPVYTDASINAGSTSVKAVHITELRAAVVALEQ